MIFGFLGAAYTMFWSWPKRCERLKDPKALNKYLTNPNYPGRTEDDYYKNPRYFDLHPLNHVGFLIHSIISWPFMLFWDLLHDPITWFGHTIYDLCSGMLLKVAVRISRR